ncbi:MAG: transposase [Candidatus Delongbacteria bacterium]|nr:transposase [Candidatus Delongbacteria bacterium]
MYNRRSIRLKEFDYSQIGYYYITICTLDRYQLFGRIVNNKMVLNKFGLIAQKEWKNTSVIRQNVELDEFIIMPDHIHGIIIINRRGVMPYALKNDLNNENIDYNNIDHENDMRTYGNTPLPFMENVQKNTPLRSPIQTIGSIIRGYKSAVTIKVNQIRKTPKIKIWQRNYFERIIRNQKALEKIRYYIRNNPENYKI